MNHEQAKANQRHRENKDSRIIGERFIGERFIGERFSLQPKPATPEPISKNPKTKKPSDLLGCDGGRVPPMAYLVTPTGVEPVLPP